MSKVAEENYTEKAFQEVSNTRIQLFHQDCFAGMRELDANSIDMVATDPPYFIDGMGDEWDDKQLNRRTARAGVVKGLPTGMKFDPRQGKRLQEFIYRFSLEAFRLLKPGAFMLIFAQGRLYHRLAVAVEDAGFEVRDMLIWKHNGGMAKAFTQDHFVRRMDISEEQKQEIIEKLGGRKTPQLRPVFEPIVLAQKPREGTFVENWLKWKTGLIQTAPSLLSLNGSCPATAFAHKKPKKKIAHLTVKPVELMEELIAVFTKEEQIVMDPFMGSGTTGIAARNTGRRFIGFEREQTYFDLSSKRIL